MREVHVKKKERRGYTRVPFIRKVHKEYPPLSSKVPLSIFPRKKNFIGEEGEREKWRAEITQI
jgi:hypothetical protein